MKSFVGYSSGVHVKALDSENYYCVVNVKSPFDKNKTSDYYVLDEQRVFYSKRCQICRCGGGKKCNHILAIKRWKETGKQEISGDELMEIKQQNMELHPLIGDCEWIASNKPAFSRNGTKEDIVCKMVYSKGNIKWFKFSVKAKYYKLRRDVLMEIRAINRDVNVEYKHVKSRIKSGHEDSGGMIKCVLNRIIRKYEKSGICIVERDIKFVKEIVEDSLGCAYCGNMAECRCKECGMPYCCRKHQKLDWIKHKKYCLMRRKLISKWVK